MLKIRTEPTAPLRTLPKAPETYSELLTLIRQKMPALQLVDVSCFQLTYIDEEGDTIELTDD
jgi:hypothetical protein